MLLVTSALLVVTSATLVVTPPLDAFPWTVVRSWASERSSWSKPWAVSKVNFRSKSVLATSKALVTRSGALVPSSFLLLVRPGAPSSFLLLLVRHLLLEAVHLFLVASCS